MSENSKSRQGRIRRNVTALVSAVALACGTVAVPQVAGAYTPTEMKYPQGMINSVGSPDGPGPTVVSHVQSIEKVGDEYEVKLSGEVRAPNPVNGQSQDYGQANLQVARVTVAVDGGILARPPQAGDFIWEDGVNRTATVQPFGTSGWQVTFPEAGEGGNFTATFPIVPKSSAEHLEVDMLAFGAIFPKTDWVSNEDAHLEWDDSRECSVNAIQSHTFHGGGYGEWMGEIWLGPNLKGMELSDVNIDFIAPDGTNISNEVLKNTELKLVGRRPVLSLPPESKFPAADWQWTLNWPFDKTTPVTGLGSENRVYYSGTGWIPDGTRAVIKQRVTDLTCDPNKSRGDRWERYAHQAYLSSGRTDLVTEDYSVKRINLPGSTTPTTTANTTATTTPTTTANTTVTTTPSTTANTTVTTTPTTTANTTVTTTPSTTVNTTVTTTPSTTANTTVTTTPSTTANTTVTTTPSTTANTTKTEFTTVTETAGTTVTETPTVTEDCDCAPVTVTATETQKVSVHTATTETKTEPAPKRGEIGDRVWVDENGDGKEDPGEKTGVPGVTVEIVNKAGDVVTRTVTDKNGNWKVDVEPGDYTVRYVPGNNTPSDPRQVERTITIKPGEKNFNVDLGILPKSSIGDRVWNDEDGDGKQGPNEKGLENVVVLVSRDGEPTRSAVTDKNGHWKIEGLNPNKEYEVRFIKPEGWEVTGKVPGSDESGLISKVTLEPKQYNDTYDLGLRKIDGTCDCEPEEPGTIGDRVWIDVNGDGKEDSDEKTGVPGVTVVISDKDGNEVTRTVTDNDGNWKVDVVPGDYTVTYEPADHTPSQPNQITRKILVEPGKKYLDIDLGILPRGTVGDRVWNDEDGDGVQDDNEKGLRDVVVQVSRNGEPTRTTTTDENGNWFIKGLKPNTEYQVRFIKPEGWDVTGKVPGSDESGLISQVTLRPGERNDAYDLGLRRTPTTPVAPPEQPGKFGGNIIVINPDGSKEGVENVIVRATPPSDVDEPVRTGTTDKDGAWTITNLTPNVEYEVTYILPKGYRVTYLPDGATLDKDGNVTVTVKVNDKVPTILDFGLEVERGGSEDPEPSTVVNTVTETVVAKPDASSDGTLEKCWANATQSPLLYLVPVALLGAVGGELARPYAALINEQINKVNAELAAAFNRNTPDWGNGGRGADREDPFAELRAQLDAANREFQKIANDPNVQRLGTAAAVILGLVALGGVLYDWCSNEPGEAKTASSTRTGGSSKRVGGQPTTTVPTSPTEPTQPTTAETPSQP